MKKNSLKRKVISVVTAMGLMAGAAAPAVNAANATIKNGYTYFTGKSSTYTDKNGNKVYNGKGYIVTKNGQKLYEQYDYFFDIDGNAVIFTNDYVDTNDTIIGEPWYDDNSNGHWISNDEFNYFQNNVNTSIPGSHINVDIQDRASLERYLEAHAANCKEANCDARYYLNYFKNDGLANGYYPNYDYSNNYTPNYNNNYNNGYNYGQQVQANPTNEGTLYTLIKYKPSGEAVYAYSGIQDVSIYGFSGWSVNSIYNENDYTLNSVFYEEANTFGNYYILDADYVANTCGLFIWKTNINGETKYCISASRYPSAYSSFEYNSLFSIVNDLKPNTQLPTCESLQANYARTLVR